MSTPSLRRLVVAFIQLFIAASASHVATAQGFESDRWGNDNCIYRLTGTGYVQTGLCRTFPNPQDVSTFDLYEATTSFHMRFVVRPDVIYIHDYTWGGDYKVLNRGTVRDALVQLSQVLAQQALEKQRQSAPQQSQTAPHLGRPTCADIAREEQIAPCVRNELPGNDFLRTQEETDYVNKSNGAALTGIIIRQQQTQEENRREQQRQDDIKDCLARKKLGYSDSRC